MDIFREEDYSELIGYLIEKLQEHQAADIVRQIKELETVNVIETAADDDGPEAPTDVKDESDEQYAMWEMGSRQSQPAAKKRKKTVKGSDREAVSESHSRPMTCKEIYFAAIDILEAYLISVPKILEQTAKVLQLEDLSRLVWENEAERPVSLDAPVDIIGAVGALTPEVQPVIAQNIQTLRSMTKDEIKKEIVHLLDIAAPSQILTLNSDTVERVYGAYIWSLCGQAVEEAGGTAVLRGIRSGAHPKSIVLRGAPGNMACKAKDFCYIDCKLKDKEFEIHLDVQYEGNSGASHEIDVSIYDHASAKAVRANGGLPKSGKLIMVIACKFYTASAQSTAPGWGFAGLINDCAGTRLNAFVSNKASRNLDKYFTNKSNIEPFTDLAPGKDAAADRFVRVIEQALRKWSK